MIEPYYDSDGITIYHGDCRDVLPALAAESVNCCVTSPPYWGLRDYGTGKWEGGDPECDHERPNNNAETTTMTGGTSTLEARHFYLGACGKCGAKRIDAQLGLEATPEAYVETMVAVFREVWRVLADDGTLWLNLGDSYATKSAGACYGWQNGKESERDTAIKNSYVHADSGLPEKNLVGIPWRVAFALQAAGWYLRSDIIWHKPNPMPESVTDRPTKSHEYLFLLTKSQKYYYDADAIREKTGTEATLDGYVRNLGVSFADKNPSESRVSSCNDNAVYQKTGERFTHPSGRNKRSVWTIPSHPYPNAHFATFPPKLIEPCIKAGCPEGGLVLDPFTGSGTTAAVAHKHGCRFVGCEISEEYVKLAVKRFVDANGFRQRSLLVV